MRRREDTERPDPLRVQGGEGPRRGPSDTVADDDGVLLAERADDARGVGGGILQVVAAGRLVRGAVAAQVERGDPEPGVDERLELVTPGPPELREPVDEEDERAAARLGDVEAGAVRRDEAVLPRARQEDGGGVGVQECEVIAATVAWACSIAFSGLGLALRRALRPRRPRIAAAMKMTPVTIA